MAYTEKKHRIRGRRQCGHKDCSHVYEPRKTTPQSYKEVRLQDVSKHAREEHNGWLIPIG
jgi:hypothetical protein